MHFSWEAQKKIHLGRTVLTYNGLDYYGFSVFPAFLYDSITLVFSVTCLFFFSLLECLCVCVCVCVYDFSNGQLMLGWVLFRGFCAVWLGGTFLQGRFAKDFLGHLCNFSAWSFLN